MVYTTKMQQICDPSPLLGPKVGKYIFELWISQERREIVDYFDTKMKIIAAKSAEISVFEEGHKWVGHFEKTASKVFNPSFRKTMYPKNFLNSKAFIAHFD